MLLLLHTNIVVVVVGGVPVAEEEESTIHAIHKKKIYTHHHRLANTFDVKNYSFSQVSAYTNTTHGEIYKCILCCVSVVVFFGMKNPHVQKTCR